jgi:hypothetical protein
MKPLHIPKIRALDLREPTIPRTYGDLLPILIRHFFRLAAAQGSMVIPPSSEEDRFEAPPPPYRFRRPPPFPEAKP